MNSKCTVSSAIRAYGHSVGLRHIWYGIILNKRMIYSYPSNEDESKFNGLNLTVKSSKSERSLKSEQALKLEETKFKLYEMSKYYINS